LTEKLREQHVVTCFLEAGGEILLLRRSGQVGSYRGRWAVVSGYLESTPDEQAFTEIIEETGLKKSDVRLVRKGEPLAVEDKELGTRWVVHPFLFRIKDREKVRLDWEHQEMKWIAPGDIGRYETVPGLAEVFARVYQT
jgi:8-oxo-dGTP diphosphatase